MEIFNGKPWKLSKIMVLRVKKEPSIIDYLKDNNITPCINDSAPLCSKYVISSSSEQPSKPGIYSLTIGDIEKMNDDDIVSIDDTGHAQRLWNIASNENILYLTDACNSHCIMCPQSVFSNPHHYYELSNKIVDLLPKNYKGYISITGGEPTVSKECFLSVLSNCKKKLNLSEFIVLTNGRNFSNFGFAKEAVLAAPQNIIFAIPLYSFSSNIHDKHAGTPGAFKETVAGILNLYRLYQKVEIRIVVTKLNADILQDMAHFIFWNFPFVSHVAFMGMETHGSAKDNIKYIWIEPVDYMEELITAVQYISMRGMRVSIYNIPLCLIPPEQRKYARQSISSWKNSLMDTCNMCSEKDFCAGFFTTSVRQPKGIHSI